MVGSINEEIHIAAVSSTRKYYEVEVLFSAEDVQNGSKIYKICE